MLRDKRTCLDQRFLTMISIKLMEMVINLILKDGNNSRNNTARI